jgi:hypothetical protein
MAYGIEPPIQDVMYPELSETTEEVQPKTPPKRNGEDKNKILFFPKELDKKSSEGFPFVRFSVVGTGISINLPMPAGGIVFNDSATYSTIDLGIIGTVSDAMNLAGEEVAGAGSQEQQQGFLDKLTSGFSGSSVGTLIAKSSGVEKISAIADLASKKAVAKNTHITFQSNNVREFSFQFKLVAKSAKETEQIKKIVDEFRYQLYAELEENGIVVQYPKRWIIQFFHGGNVNNYIPDIKISHLKSLQANYNSGTNLFHWDGAPIEVDITLQYQESKGIYKADLLVPKFEGYKYAEAGLDAEGIVEDVWNGVERVFG